MDTNDTIMRVKKLLIEVMKLDMAPEEINDDELLYGGRFGMDSMAILTLVVALEDEFGIDVDDDDLRVDLFESVRRLADYVENCLRRVP